MNALHATFLLVVAAPALCSAQDKYFDAAGVRLRYLESGAGEPIVLVHGFGNTAEIWSDNGIVQSLSRDHRVISFDARGHGKSEKPHDPARYGREMALDIVRLLDHLHIQRAHIVGLRLCKILAIDVASAAIRTILFGARPAHHFDALVPFTAGEG